MLSALKSKVQQTTASLLGATKISPSKRRLVVMGGLLAPTCEACIFFDHELGQEAMAKFDAFFNAAKHLTPEQMAKTDAAVRGEVDWDEQGPKLDPKLAVTRWEEYGACKFHNEGVHKGHTCKDYR